MVCSRFLSSGYIICPIACIGAGLIVVFAVDLVIMRSYMNPRSTQPLDFPKRPIQAIWYLGPIAALVYPFVLMGYSSMRSSITDGGGIGSWIGAGLLLLIAIFLPLIALITATRLGKLSTLSAAEILARRVAFVSIAASPIFVLAGVLFLLLGKPTWDLGFVTLVWGVLIVLISVADRSPSRTQVEHVPSDKMRTWHGIAAVVAVVFLCFHFSNHLVGLVGSEAHMSVMKVLRVAYRSTWIEPVLLCSFFFLIGSGAYMAWRMTNRQADAIRSFQIAGGVFLIFAVISHINAVLYLARAYFNIDSNWGFAIGAPTGLLNDAWNIRLLPYYLLAVFFVISHAFCGLRGVMIAHKVNESTSRTVLVAGIFFSALLAITIILAMTGMRVHFE